MVYFKDCDNRRNPINCPMCYEVETEYDYDGYCETDYVLHDNTEDDNYCKYGIKEES